MVFGLRPTKRDQSGQVLVEFAVILPVWLLFILGIVQFSLLYVGKTVVEYASFMASRAVLVSEDPDEAAATICSQITGTTNDGPSASTSITVPGWGELPRSAAAKDKTRVIIVEDDRPGDVRVMVEHDFELMIPIVNVIICEAYDHEADGYGQHHLTLRSEWTTIRPWGDSYDSAGMHDELILYDDEE